MNEKIINTSLAIGGSLLAVCLSTASFRPFIKHSMMREVNERSKLDGDASRPLEAAHLNHERGKRSYGKSHNGLIVNDIQHLAHHMMFCNSPRDIGLTIKENNKAIRSLRNRIFNYNKRNGLPTSNKYLREQVEIAIDLWRSYLKMES